MTDEEIIKKALLEKLEDKTVLNQCIKEQRIMLFAEIISRRVFEIIRENYELTPISEK